MMSDGPGTERACRKKQVKERNRLTYFLLRLYSDIYGEARKGVNASGVGIADSQCSVMVRIKHDRVLVSRFSVSIQTGRSH
jgi:hypothetical protein